MSEGGLTRGLDFLMSQRAKISASRDYVPKLFLRTNGDIAKFRFMTDIADVISHNFHEVSVQGRSRTFTKDVICGRKVALNKDTQELDFTGGVDECVYCNRQEPLQMWWKGVAWVYTYGIFSVAKTNDRQQPARRLEAHGFAEVINEPRLLILKGLIADMVGSAGGRYGTLCDRNYELERKGKEAAQYYELVGLDRSPPPENVLQYITYEEKPIEGNEDGLVTVKLAATDQLPDLLETVLKEFSLGTGTPEVVAPVQSVAPAPAVAPPVAGPPVAVGTPPQAPAPAPDTIVEF